MNCMSLVYICLIHLMATTVYALIPSSCLSINLPKQKQVNDLWLLVNKIKLL